MPLFDPLDTHLVHPDDVPYAVLERSYGNTLMKLVHVNVAQQVFTNIIKWESGIRLPRHYHTGPVYAYTFEGSWHYLEYDWVATAGSYVYEPPGTTHTLEVLEPTVAMFVSQGAFLWYDSTGKLSSMQDAASTLADCEAALEKQGLKLPEGVVTG
ncbi:MAG: 2,4'-dihydroxyacetophenone dioxygenase family protein [Acidimicrobiia bacterium]